jgi:hypothetical protein
MKNPELIQAEWEGFERSVLPPAAGPVQRSEMQKAFFAGALSLMNVLMNRVSNDEEVTEADDQLMDHLHAELTEFGEKVVRDAGS